MFYPSIGQMNILILSLEASVISFCLPLTAVLTRDSVKHQRLYVNVLFCVILSVFLSKDLLAIPSNLPKLAFDFSLVCLVLFLLYYNQVPQYKKSIEIVKDCVFAPFCEELLYRKVLAGNFFVKKYHFSHSHANLFSSLLFSLAHLPTKFTKNLSQVSFVFTYTFIFGLFSNWIFFRTGQNVFASLFCHSFCNLMGIPSRCFSLRLAIAICILVVWIIADSFHVI